MSGGANSIDVVRKKIRVLQEQAEEAEDRAERLQKDMEKEMRTREEVRTPFIHLYKLGRRVSTPQVLSDAVSVCVEAEM